MDERGSYVSLPNVTLKADKKEKDVVYLEASNTKTDTQREVVLKSALEAEKDNYLRKGVISWNHLHKIKGDPSYIIGEPLDVRFDGDDKTLVKARIYSTNRYGQAVLDLARADSTRLGASIGGFVVRAEPHYDEGLKKSVRAIARIIWDEVAVTHEPINEMTTMAGGGFGVAVMPFEEFRHSWIQDPTEREAVLKALTAGYGTDAATMTGGTALIRESLQGAKGPKKDCPRRRMRLRAAFGNLLDNIYSGGVKTKDDMRKMMRSYGVEDAVEETALLVADMTKNTRRRIL